MEDLYNKVVEASEYLKAKGLNEPEVGIILGTGLGRRRRDFGRAG